MELKAIPQHIQMVHAILWRKPRAISEQHLTEMLESRSIEMTILALNLMGARTASPGHSIISDISCHGIFR